MAEYDNIFAGFEYHGVIPTHVPRVTQGWSQRHIIDTQSGQLWSTVGRQEWEELYVHCM